LTLWLFIEQNGDALFDHLAGPLERQIGRSKLRVALARS
jgi:hypothetical protein